MSWQSQLSRHSPVWTALLAAHERLLLAMPETGRRSAAELRIQITIGMNLCILNGPALLALSIPLEEAFALQAEPGSPHTGCHALSTAIMSGATLN